MSMVRSLCCGLQLCANCLAHCRPILCPVIAVASPGLLGNPQQVSAFVVVMDILRCSCKAHGSVPACHAGEQEGKRKRAADMQAELAEVRQKLMEAETAQKDQPAEGVPAPTAVASMRAKRRELSARLDKSRDEVCKSFIGFLSTHELHDMSDGVIACSISHV